MRRPASLVRCLVLPSAIVAILALGAPAFAQLPPDNPPQAGQRPGRRGLPPGAPQLPPDTLNNEQVFRILDAHVLAGAQRALQLNDAQWAAFFQRMTRLQDMQRRHRQQRQRVLNQLRMMVGPRAQQQGVDDATVAAKAKELDDQQVQFDAEERAVIAEIDQVLQVRQRAHFRLFLENMERQKLDLLIRARQGGQPNPPAPAPPPAGRGQ